MRKWLKKKWRWLRQNILNKQMILPAIIGELIFWSPVWVTAILAILISPWWWTVTGAVIAFWCAPLTPAIILQLSFILILGKLMNRRKKKQKQEA